MFSKIKERVFSRQFLNLLMIKMLIPAMATGGMSAEFGAHNPFYMFINTATTSEVSIMETADIYVNSIESNSAIIDSVYYSNTADDSIAMLSTENASLSTKSCFAYFIEQHNFSNHLESEVKLPSLTFT